MNDEARKDADHAKPAVIEIRPPTPDAFQAWSTEKTCGVFDQSTRAWYETSQNNLYARVQEHPFLGRLENVLADLAEEYQQSFGASLFAIGRQPTVRWHKKPYSSFVEKLFRLNCVQNPQFPEAPDGGWISLDRSYDLMDDIVRTTVVVAYADAPPFVARRLTSLAEQQGVACTVKDHAKEKGYYAYHLYPKLTIPVPNTLGSREFPEREVAVEIQITTELQAALREITHRLYERERISPSADDGWKSNFESGRFRAAYMAHSLRFIEAMIVDLRNRVHAGEAS